MIHLDEKHTQEYILALNSLAKSLLRSGSNIPPSIDEAFFEYIGKLESETSSYLKLAKKPTRKITKRFSIEPNILFNYKNPLLKGASFFVSLGGYIQIEDSVLIEQSFNIMLLYRHKLNIENNKLIKGLQFYELEDGLHILRRFHFDLDMNNDGINKPKSHLQYGGKFKKEYFNVQENMIYKLFSHLDHPRIPLQPFDLIMIFDFMFREFQLEGNNVILEKSWMKNMVQSEDFWLKPYYECLINRIGLTTRVTPIHYMLDN